MIRTGATTSSASQGTISIYLFGSTAARRRRVQAIVDAINAAFESGNLTVDDHGLYKQVFDVGGNSVTVSGRIIDGVVRVATAWIPP
jgi:hypothetical protein